MQKGPSGGKRVSRAILYVIPSLLILLALALSAFWYWTSTEAAKAMDQWLKSEAEAGRDWDCHDRKIAGYPFRIEILCPALGFKAKDGAVAEIKAGRVLAVWQIYQPKLIIVEFDRIINFSMRDGSKQDLNTTSLRMSLHFETPDQPDRLALVGEGVSLPNLLSAQSAEIHILRGGEEDKADDLRFYIESQSTEIDVIKRIGTKPMTIAVDARASRGAVLFSHGAGSVLDRWREAGGKLHINGIKIDRGESELQLKGTLALDETHRLNGKADLKANGFSDLLDIAGLKTGGFTLNAKSLSLPLTFERGHVLVGPLKLGDIPPLY